MTNDQERTALDALKHPAVKPDMLVNGGALKLALNVLRRAGKNEVADELECTAQAGEPWYGHKFKEQHRGIWSCECGKTVKETTADWLDSVQEDAARYRWLREGNDAKHGAAWHVAVNLYGCEWDAAIDAAQQGTDAS